VSLAQLENEHGMLPSTVRTVTGKGRHIYFKAVDGLRNSASRLGPGLDTRGDGGYVLLPPSGHVSGRAYRWDPAGDPDEHAVADAPAWLLSLLRPKVEEPPPRSEFPIIPGGRSRYIVAAIVAECTAVATAGEGTRNDQLNRSAYALARFIGTGEAREAELRDVLTVAARAAGLGSIEIKDTLASAFRARRSA